MPFRHTPNSKQKKACELFKLMSHTKLKFKTTQENETKANRRNE